VVWEHGGSNPASYPIAELTLAYPEGVSISALNAVVSLQNQITLSCHFNNFTYCFCLTPGRAI
jgi:hypothetical protein